MLIFRSVMLAAVTFAGVLVPAGVASAAATVVVDADGAASVTSCDATGAAPRSVTAALELVADGGTILVCPGLVVESGQVVIDRDLTVRGFDPARPPVLAPGADTGTVGDDRGWLLVRRGATFSLRDVELDGAGRRIHQAVRFRGDGEVRDVTFTDVAYGAAGPERSGFAVVAFGDGPVTVRDSTFRRIGRVGALFFGEAVSGSAFVGNRYHGKGAGDHLDYGVEVGDGAVVRVEDSTITRALGEADGAVSAGVLVSTAFGGGAGIHLTGSTLSGNANGVFLDDAAGHGLGAVTVARNRLSGNAVLGVAWSGQGSVAAACNWWGATDGPTTAGGSGNGASPGVETVPFLTASDTGGRCSADPLLTADVSETVVAEASVARVTGTFEAGSNAPLRVTASSGSVTTTGSNIGTWTWTATPADGPGDGTTVVVTGDNGRPGATSFSLQVRNVVPTATFEAPGTAFTDRPFTLAVRSLTDVSGPDRAAGLSAVFDCGTGTSYGAAGTATEIECTVARGGRRTVRALIADKDGGTREFSAVVEVYSPDGDGAPDRSAAGTVAPGGVVSTGSGEATPGDPIVTRALVPSGGEVTIEEGPPNVTEPQEHELLAWGSTVSAPEQTAAEPLETRFRLDADLLPASLRPAGVLAFEVVRDGVVVPACLPGDERVLPCLAGRWAVGDDAVLDLRSRDAGAFGFVVPTVACPTGGATRTSFEDVWDRAHEDAVTCAQRWDLVRGLAATTYGPEGAVTRAQAASMLARLLALAGVELPAEPEDRFTDDDGSVHELAISQLAELGVVHGRTATRFAPASSLTRGQFASIVARAYEVALGRPLATGEDRFRDDDGTAHEAAIDAVAAAGLANGVSSDRFAPHGLVRRDQTASFLTRLLAAWYADVRR